MSLLESQLRTAHRRINKCEELTHKIDDAGSNNLELNWLKDDLVKARSSLDKIDIKIVESLRRQRKSTADVLDEHVSEAEDKFQASVSGVFTCIDDLNDHFSKERNADAVLTLEKLRKLARKTLRTLNLMTRPKLAFFLSWRGFLLIIALGLIATCLLYVSHYAIHRQSGLSPAQSLTTKAASDMKTIHEAASDPDASLIDRSLKTVTTIINLLPKMPKAILGITASIAALQGLLAALAKLFK